MLDRRLGVFAAGLSSVLLLSACGGDGDLTEGSDDEGEAASDCEPQADPPEIPDTEIPVAEAVDGDEDESEIEIALIPWEEAIAVTNMWKVILEELDYDVTITDVDVAPMYQGVANGDIDMFFDTWLPQTHIDYWDDHGDDLENLGVWYDNAILTLTVPEYVDEVDSIADLRDNAEMFDGQITGIDSGSGLFRTTEDHAIPGYCLDDFEQVESSGAAMLAELDSAIEAEEPIVVTLWRPHIAYAQYDLKDLTDEGGYMGGAEQIHMVGRDGFSEDFPQVRGWLDEFVLDDAELEALETLTLDEHSDDPEEGARVWLSENPEFLERTLGDDAESVSV